jgi:Ca2+-binding EF-hand superfamily protein
LFRNAEYVVTLQQLLNIKSRSLEEYKRVFDEIDKDGSGFIEVRL